MQSPIIAFLILLVLAATPGQCFSQSISTSEASSSKTTTQEQDVVRVDTDLVNIPFTVLDRNRRFITDLKKVDIRILENGVEQEILLFEQETARPVTMVIVADLSKSQERTLSDQKRAANAFISSVIAAGKDRVALVSFTGQPRLEQQLTTDVARLSSAVDRLEIEFPPSNPLCEEYRPVHVEHHCWSSIWDAVWATTKHILSKTEPTSRRTMILLSDGDDSSSKISREETAEFALLHNTVVYSIGIGDSKRYRIDRSALRKLSERTGGRAFFPKGDDQLNSSFAQIRQELRSQYVLAYSPSNRLRDGAFREVKIEIVNREQRRRRLQLLYRRGYYAGQVDIKAPD